MTNVKLPKTLPIMRASMITGTQLHDGRKHCPIGWTHRFAEKAGNLAIGDVLQRAFYDEIFSRHRSWPSIIGFAYGEKPRVVAQMMNRAWKRLGYVLKRGKYVLPTPAQIGVSK